MNKMRWPGSQTTLGILAANFLQCEIAVMVYVASFSHDKQAWEVPIED